MSGRINCCEQTYGGAVPGNFDTDKLQRAVSESTDAWLAAHSAVKTQVGDDAADKSILRAIWIGEGFNGGCETFFQNRTGPHDILREFRPAYTSQRLMH